MHTALLHLKGQTQSLSSIPYTDVIKVTLGGSHRRVQLSPCLSVRLLGQVTLRGSHRSVQLSPCLSVDYLIKSHLEVVIDTYSYHLACQSDYLVRPRIGIYKELISWSYSYHLDCQFARIWNYT